MLQYVLNWEFCGGGRKWEERNNCKDFLKKFSSCQQQNSVFVITLSINKTMTWSIRWTISGGMKRKCPDWSAKIPDIYTSKICGVNWQPGCIRIAINMCFFFTKKGINKIKIQLWRKCFKNYFILFSSNLCRPISLRLFSSCSALQASMQIASACLSTFFSFMLNKYSTLIKWIKVKYTFLKLLSIYLFCSIVCGFIKGFLSQKLTARVLAWKR